MTPAGGGFNRSMQHTNHGLITQIAKNAGAITLPEDPFDLFLPFEVLRSTNFQVR